MSRTGRTRVRASNAIPNYFVVEEEYAGGFLQADWWEIVSVETSEAKAIERAKARRDQIKTALSYAPKVFE